MYSGQRKWVYGVKINLFSVSLTGLEKCNIFASFEIFSRERDSVITNLLDNPHNIIRKIQNCIVQCKSREITLTKTYTA